MGWNAIRMSIPIPMSVLLDMAIPFTVAEFNLGVGIAVILLAGVVAIEAAILVRIGPGMSARAALLRSFVMNAVSAGVGMIGPLAHSLNRIDDVLEFPRFFGASSRFEAFMVNLRWSSSAIIGSILASWRGWLPLLLILWLITLVIEFVVLRLMWRSASWTDVLKATTMANFASYALLAVIVPILQG